MTKKSFFIKLMVFIFGCTLILHKLDETFVLKENFMHENINSLISKNYFNTKIRGFYELEPNSLDVVFIGSSNVHCNINPNVIWNQYGITSYDFSCDMQDLQTSYYYIKEVFKTQSPKVIMVDMLYPEKRAENPTYAHYAFDYMNNDLEKAEAVWKLSSREPLQYFIPSIMYHDRWKTLGKTDYEELTEVAYILNGSVVYMSSNSAEQPIITDDKTELSDDIKSQIDEIVELCHENGCECVFMKTPIAHDESLEGRFALWNSISEYCGEKEIDFLYFNRIIDELGLDYATDYMDTNHLNYYGQEKLSKYIGGYLTNQKGIVDNRENEQYNRWNSDYNAMMEYIDKFDNYWEEYCIQSF